MAWKTETTTHFVVYGVEGSFAAARLGALAETAQQARSVVLDQLGESEAGAEPRAHIFLVRGPDDLRTLVGQPAGGWAEPDANAILAVATDSTPPPLRHELAHLYSHRLWGRPHSAWLSEGVAVFAVGHCAGVPLHAWAAAIQRGGETAGLELLEREFDFTRAAPHLLAGSFVAFVAESHGMAAVRALWGAGLAATEQATGLGIAALESAWHEALRRTEVPRDLPDHRGRVRCEVEG